jgi:hypothetical protein
LISAKNCCSLQEKYVNEANQSMQKQKKEKKQKQKETETAIICLNFQ